MREKGFSTLRRRAGVGVFVLCFIVAVSVVQARSIYVSTEGNDNTMGTYFRPFKTIQKAADTVQAGDSVCVLSGYYRQRVVINNVTATKEKPVLFKAIGEVVIEGPPEISLYGYDVKIGDFNMPLASPSHPYYPYYRGAVVRIENSTSVTFDGFAVHNSRWFGISALNCRDLKIQYCTTDNTMSSGIYVLDSKDVTVAYNEIIRACGYMRRHAVHGSQEFISMVNCVGFEVMYNRVHDSGTWEFIEGSESGVGGEGIDAKEHSQNGKIHHNYVYNLSRLGIYTDAWDVNDAKNIEIFNNVIHNCSAGISVGSEQKGTITDIKIYNNLVYNSRGPGIGLVSFGNNGRKENIAILNNTVYNTAGIALGSALHKGIEVFNNISFRNGQKPERSYDPGEAKDVRAEGNLFGIDPRFVNAGMADFRLGKGSPAIDKGVGSGQIPFDLADLPRVSGKAIDAGAFEYSQ